MTYDTDREIWEEYGESNKFHADAVQNIRERRVAHYAEELSHPNKYSLWALISAEVTRARQKTPKRQRTAHRIDARRARVAGVSTKPCTETFI
jgi:hypothetical protein